MFVTVSGKLKSIVLWVLVVTVGIIAGALYWYIHQSAGTVDRSNAMPVNTVVASEPLQLAASPDFFIEYRLERDKVRSERSDVLREIIKNSKNDSERSKAQDTVLKMVQDKQRELEIENLIKSRGFGDALVFIRDDSINAVVKSAVLSREEVLQVAEIIHRVAGVKVEDINISAKP